MIRLILSLEIRFENDVVSVRQRARQISALLGFDDLEQTRIATAASEIARNAFQYAGQGKAEFLVEDGVASGNPSFLVRVTDKGPGVTDLDAILEGRYKGAGMGILSARRLVDQFQIESAPGRGTTVLLGRRFPPAAVLPPLDLGRITKQLARQSPQDPLEEVRQQNLELARTLEELRTRQEELIRLNRELEETNRGVIALYAELDEKASHLRRADELKSRFLSNMSHEFRTPVNSVISLCRLMLEHSEEKLSPEQVRQVSFIRKSAQDLLELVNDLLDLAKVEAGRITITPAPMEVASLFGALRGMFRPLLTASSVSLVFEEPAGIPTMFTDEGKVSQILRNFISNALKFTERGEVRLSARFWPERQTVVFSVADTGIGIAPEDQELVFQEFAQLEHPLQKRVKGTGLGLPLARKLAELLGGSLRLDSRPGAGSTFFAELPVACPGAKPEAAAPGVQPDPARPIEKVLIVDDDEVARYVLRTLLAGTRCQVIEAGGGIDGLRRAREDQPQLILLDLIMPDLSGFEVLRLLKADPQTRQIPVIIVTEKALEEEERRRLATQVVSIFSKETASREEAITRLREALIQANLAPAQPREVQS